MARSPAKRYLQAPTGFRLTAMLLAFIFLAGGGPATAPAAAPREETNIEADIWSFERDGSWTLDGNVQISHGHELRITAERAHGVDKPDGVIELDVTSNVHVEFRGAVLDAESAFLVIRDEEVLSAAVKGSQARFSHPRNDPGRRVEGSADAIDYLSSNDEVRFSGSTSWTDGRIDLRTDVVVYNIVTGVAKSPTRGSGVLRSRDRERVPPPRTPERSTAQ